MGKGAHRRHLIVRQKIFGEFRVYVKLIRYLCANYHDMRKNFKSLAICISIGCLLAIASQSCDKKPAQTQPKQEIPTAPVVEDLTDAVLPIDTIKPDSVKTDDYELPRVMTKETADLLAYMDTCADAYKYSQGILRRMAYDSPEYTKKLLNTKFSHFIIVDKQAMQLALFDRYGREELRYGIACGKNFGTKAKKGDCRTSEGFFSAEGIYDSTDWLYTDDNGVTSPKKGQFGPRFVRLLIPETRAIGIHGTCAPGSIGRRTSHGCIRVKNENILELVKHVTVGMPIIVSPSDRDVAVNREEGRYIAQVTINPHKNRSPLVEKEERERIKKIQEAKQKKEAAEKAAAEADSIAAMQVEIPESAAPSESEAISAPQEPAIAE